MKKAKLKKGNNTITKLKKVVCSKKQAGKIANAIVITLIKELQ